MTSSAGPNLGPYVMHRADGARTGMDDGDRRSCRVACGDSREIALHPAARPLAGRAAPLTLFSVWPPSQNADIRPTTLPWSGTRWDNRVRR